MRTVESPTRKRVGIFGSAGGTPDNGTPILLTTGTLAANASLTGTITGNFIGDQATPPLVYGGKGVGHVEIRTASGFVSEGAGENLFVIKNGVVYTPDLSAGALNGITRNTVFAICEDLGLKLVEKRITRDEVYIADEAFFTGTAAEVTPIRELDRIEIGAGSRGPITEKIQSAFFDIVNGRNAKYAEWLAKV